MKPSEKEIIGNTVPADEKITSDNTRQSPSKEGQYKIHINLKEPKLEIKTPEAPKKPKPTKIIVLKPPTENDNPKKKPNNKTNKQQIKTTNNK